MYAKLPKRAVDNDLTQHQNGANKTLQNIRLVPHKLTNDLKTMYTLPGLSDHDSSIVNCNINHNIIISNQEKYTTSESQTVNILKRRQTCMIRYLNNTTTDQ